MDGYYKDNPNEICHPPQNDSSMNQESGKCETDCKDPEALDKFKPVSDSHNINGVCVADSTLDNAACTDPPNSYSSLTLGGECV